MASKEIWTDDLLRFPITVDELNNRLGLAFFDRYVSTTLDLRMLKNENNPIFFITLGPPYGFPWNTHTYPLKHPLPLARQCLLGKFYPDRAFNWWVQRQIWTCAYGLGRQNTSHWFISDPPCLPAVTWLILDYISIAHSWSSLKFRRSNWVPVCCSWSRLTMHLSSDCGEYNRAGHTGQPV